MDKQIMMCPRRLAVLAGAFIVTASSILGLFAAYPLATDDAGTVKLNSYELEAGYDNCRDENKLLNQSCGISFKHGITEKMDIGLSVPLQVSPVKEERLGEASIILKFSLVRDILAASFSNELGGKDYFLNAIYTKEFPSVIFNLNAGYLSTGDETVKGTGTYGASFEIPIKKFEVAGEVHGQEGGTGNGLVGLRYRISESIFVATGFSRLFDSNTNKVTAGFHSEF
ncbi:MAG: hypothetical protein NT145_07735 [Elusimicrobia bacterium]|nr:hypothetical protein [Elusimicrobiota bacterium]